MRPKYAPRRDVSEPGIVDGLEACGWECVRLSSGELPDLLCRHRGSGQLALLEIESGHYKRIRSKAQREMLAAWNIPIVKTLEEAVRALGGRIS
jgi:hypothetical protein